MVFSSPIFLFAFLPAVLVLDRLLHSIRAKNTLLLAASLLFYSFGQLTYLPLLLASAALNYGCGRMAAGRYRRAGVALAAAGGLGLLCVFKYAAFLTGIINALTGWELPLPRPALPAGISFFTFQGLSYVIDVYRDRTAVSRSFARVLLYISLFPQLIAGPIVKYRDIEPMLSARWTDERGTAHGICRFLFGMSKKLLIANPLGQMADVVFSLAAADLGLAAAWLGAVCYTMQIYFDFSGYSDMAIGMGRMFGFRFRENFDEPYTSTGIQEFWRRWHISLSSWFRDYLYIPLGGNRRGRVRTWCNRMLVFLATGLWHGASWNFVLWGLWHGLFTVLEDCGVIPAKRMRGRLFGHIYTLLVVITGFVLFRADTLEQAGAVLHAMIPGTGVPGGGLMAVCPLITPAFVVVLALSVLLCVPAVKRRRPKSECWTLAGASALLILCMLDLASGSYNPFIYFRF